MMVIVIAGIGVWPCSYAIAGETSSLEMRAKSQGIGWLTSGFANAFFGFVSPYIFNSDQGDLGAKTGFVWAALCCISFVLVYFFVPEMKGRPYSEIDQMFEEGVSARHSVHWKPSSTSAAVRSA